MRKIIFGFFCIVVISCNKVNLDLDGTVVKFSENELEKVHYLTSENVKILSDSLFRPTTINAIQDQYLVISDLGSKYALHIYDSHSNIYIGKYGKKGFGPGEIQVPWKLYESDCNRIGVFDIEQSKIVEFEVPSTLLDTESIIDIKLPPGVNSNGTIRFADKIYFLDSNNPHARLYSADLEGKHQEKFGTLPNLEKHYPKIPKSELAENTGLGKLVNFRSSFAISYYNIPLLQIFNLELDEWISIFGPDKLPIPSLFGQTTFYGSVYLTKNFVYALYYGREDPFENPSKTIYVFNHNGELEKKLVLDTGIFEFTVINDSVLFGLSRNVGKSDYALVKFFL